MHKMVVCVGNIKALVLTDVWVYVVNKQKYNILLLFYFIIIRIIYASKIYAICNQHALYALLYIITFCIVYCVIVFYPRTVFAPSFLISSIEWRN